MRLSSTQKHALVIGSYERWQGAKDNGVMGNTMGALADRGLADLRIVDRKGRVVTSDDRYVGSNSMQYRLTVAGVKEKAKLVQSEAVRGY